MSCFSVKFLTVFGRMFTSSGEMAFIALAEVVMMVYVPIKALGPVEPGSRTDEYPAIKPLGAIVAVWSAIIRRHFVVAIRASGRRADVD
jgi:hypothetical protein